MTKREVTGSEAGVLNALLRDCEQMYPADRKEWVRDSKRIHLSFTMRGWGFFTLDLPALGDSLLVGLRDGRLDVKGGAAFSRRRSKTDLRPRIFHGLWKRIFSEDGLLLDDVDPTAVFLLLSLTNVWKKAEIECSMDRVKQSYVDYFNIEEELPKAHEMWSNAAIERDACGSLTDFAGSMFDEPSTYTGLTPLLEGCQWAADALTSALGFFEPEEVIGRHGPGAVSDMGSGRDKYSFPSWSDRLESVFPFDMHGTLNSAFVLHDGKITLPVSFEEGASYLIDVPKTQKAPRLIAEEPTSNQWIQQGISDILRDRVKATRLGCCIDFFDQRPSQEACRVASHTGKTATIDLSSASDRLSCSLVQRVFRANPGFLEAMIVSRTRFLKQDKFEDLPKLIELRKFASMGSALTFPVQSIVFAILAVGVGGIVERYTDNYLRRNDLDWLCRQVRVFGDDIIVPNTWVAPLNDVLVALGLKVNVSKSFSTGFFRESCGLYAYKGYDVTPFRVRHPFNGTDGTIRASWVTSSANAFLKGLWHTSKHMESVVFEGRKVLATTVGVSSFGLPTYCKGLDPSAKKRWDKDTQQVMVSGLGIKMLKTRKLAEQGVNALTSLARKSYKDLSVGLGLLQAPPSKGALIAGIDKNVDGPGMLVRSWVPERLI